VPARLPSGPSVIATPSVVDPCKQMQNKAIDLEQTPDPGPRAGAGHAILERTGHPMLTHEANRGITG